MRSCYFGDDDLRGVVWGDADQLRQHLGSEAEAQEKLNAVGLGHLRAGTQPSILQDEIGTKSGSVSVFPSFLPSFPGCMM